MNSKKPIIEKEFLAFSNIILILALYDIVS